MRRQLTSLFSLFVLTAVLPAKLSASDPAGFNEMYDEMFGRSRLAQAAMQSALAMGHEAPITPRVEDSRSAVGRKSKGRAFLKSLVLPGWGQHYAGSGTMMKVFAVSEVVLWSTYLGFRLDSGWKKNDYRNLAASNAGVDLAGKTAGYFFNIGIYDNIHDYNQARLRDRDVRSLYPEDGTYDWDWDSADNRIRFDGLRIKSDESNNNANMTLAFIFVNHLVSALQATLAVHHFNERLEQKGIGMNFDFDGFGENRRIALAVIKTF